MPAGIAPVAVLVASPLRVMWHGRKISLAYGDPAHIEHLFSEVPGALDEIVRELHTVVQPRGRGLRRMVSSWPSPETRAGGSRRHGGLHWSAGVAARA